MARLGRSYVLPIIVRAPAADTTPGTAESGTAAVGGSATAVAVRIASVVAVCAVGAGSVATAVHVAPRAAATTVGAAATGAAAKHAPQTGAGTVGVAGAATAAKYAPQAGTGTAGVAAAGAAAKRTAQTGVTTVGAASTAHDTEVARPSGPAVAGGGSWVVAVTKTAAVTARTTAGTASSGGAAKHTTQAGADAAGGSTSGRAVRVAAQASTGTVGAAGGAGLPAQTAVQTGTATVGTAAAGMEAKHAPQAGVAPAGLSASAPIPGAHPQTGRTCAGGTGWAAVVKVAGPAGPAAAGVSARAAGARVAAVTAACVAGTAGSGAASRRALPAATSAAGGAARASVSRSVSPAGTVCAGVAGGGAAGGRRGQAGYTAAGAATSGAARRVVAVASAVCPAGVVSAGVAVRPVAVGSPLYRVAEALLGCTDDALTTAGRPVGRACVVPGQLAWDGCDCGLLAVTVTHVYPSRSFPTDASGVANWQSCPVLYMAADLSVTVLRCAPQPAGTDLAPSCAALHGAAVEWRADAATVRAAVGCCLVGLESDGTIGEWALRDAIPLGPEGACVGVEQHLTVALCTPSSEATSSNPDVVAGILACVEAAVAATQAGPVGRACDVPGQLAWDGCDCGLLGVTVDRVYPSATFPNEAFDQVLTSPCRPPYDAMDITVSVLRCAPQPAGTDLAPTCAALDRAAEQWAFDVEAVRGALVGCLAGLEDAGTIDGWTLRASDPAGPQGGCVGSDTHLTVAVPAACLCAGG